MADVTGCTSAIAVFNEREREVDQGPVPLIPGCKDTFFFRYFQIFAAENAEGEIINAVMADVTDAHQPLLYLLRGRGEVDHVPVPVILYQIFAPENAEGDIINAVMADVMGCTSAIAVFNEREVDQGPVPLIPLIPVSH